MQRTLVIMRGLPASGKSAKAVEIMQKDPNTVRLSSDMLGEMLHFGQFSFINERDKQDVELLLAQYFLSKDKNVIIDDCNLNPHALNRWIRVAVELKASITHHDLADKVSLAECLDRDAKRDNPAGAHKISKMALQYLDEGAGEPVIICDIDGTIADCRHRQHFVSGEKKDWDSFFKEMTHDKVIQTTKDKVVKMLNDGSAQLIFVSARPEVWREETEKWLFDMLSGTGYENDFLLLMRENGDRRDDTQVKREIYERYLRNLDIIKVFDDRPKVIRMWKGLDLDVEDCGDGVEF